MFSSSCFFSPSVSTLDLGYVFIVFFPSRLSTVRNTGFILYKLQEYSKGISVLIALSMHLILEKSQRGQRSLVSLVGLMRVLPHIILPFPFSLCHMLSKIFFKKKKFHLAFIALSISHIRKRVFGSGACRLFHLVLTASATPLTAFLSPVSLSFPVHRFQ